MAIKHELLDEILRDYENPEDMFGPEGILSQFKKALIPWRAHLKTRPLVIMLVP